MKLFQEFKEFAVKGNMIDIAIGVIIGAAFNKVIDVIVKDVIMPPLSLFTGTVDFSSLKFVLKEAQMDGQLMVSQEIAMNYGKLFSVLLDFCIIAATVFIVVKFMNRLRNKSQDAQDESVATPKDIELLTKVTKLLEQQNELLAKK